MISKLILSTVFILISLNTPNSQAEEVRENVTAHRAAGSLADLNLADLPVWGKDVYKKRFSEIRDKKFLEFDGKAMVLDPSISFSRPLPLETWVSYIATDKSKAVYSICDSNAYLPTTNCSKPGPLDTKRLDDETQLYLKFEKNILLNLGLAFE